MIVDFHCHTLNSDGSLPTVDLVALMERRGVEIFSITDHDSIGAYPEMPAVKARVIPGIEINTTCRGHDVHVLGYGFDPAVTTVLSSRLEAAQAARRDRAKVMVRKLNALGYPVTDEMVAAEADGSDSLGRPHVAMALVRNGMARDIPTVFRTLLAEGGPAYVPSQYFTPLEAIEMIAASGGVPVLAHPGRIRDETIVDELCEAGLAGIEVIYPTHTPAQVALYREKAARYGLVVTAGSDFHDARWNGSMVGVEVDDDDLRGFLELVGAAG